MASKETRSGAGELREALGTPAWAASVEVEAGRDGQFSDQVQVTVTLGGEATAADVTAFVVDLPGTATEAGLDNPLLHRLRFVGVGGATLDVDWADVVADEVRRGVEEWFRVAAGLGARAAGRARTDGGASYQVTGTPVREAAELLRVAAEPDTAVQLTGTEGGLALDLATAARPTEDQLATWDALVAAARSAVPDLPARALTLHLLDRTVADLTLTAPDDTTGETFTIATYGDRVWPVVEPQLATLAARPEPWTYTASWTPAYAPDGMTLFLSLLSDRPPTDNGDEATRWSRAAHQYLERLSARR